MEGASRHAQRLANNFLDDVESMQRASRARDRRAMSHLETGAEESYPHVIHRTIHRRTPAPSVRLGSVPPSSVSYRPLYYEPEVSVPTITPRAYYRPHRYVSETPYYLTNYSGRTAEPSRPILTTHYSTAPAPITRRYTYYYPPVITGKQYYSPLLTGSYTNLSPEVSYERRRIERRMDDLLDYKLPPPEYYRDMRGSLRGLHDKLDQHRRLLDRYSGIDMETSPSSVGDRIESKYQQLASRMGHTRTVTVKA